MTDAEFNAIEARARAGNVSEEELKSIEAKPVRTEEERVLLNALGRSIMSDQEYRWHQRRIEAEEGRP
jgi:hypothetical protein